MKELLFTAAGSEVKDSGGKIEGIKQCVFFPQRRVEQIVAGERGIVSFSTSLVRRGLRVAARAT